MFDHEKLIVYQRSLSFITWVTDLLQRVGSCGSVRDQLDRASTSIPLNIAEGNGKFSPKDRARFLEIAQGSALECAAALDVLVAKGKQAPAQVEEGKEMLIQIMNLLVRLRASVLNRLRDTGSRHVFREGVEGEEEWFSLWDVEPVSGEREGERV